MEKSTKFEVCPASPGPEWDSFQANSPQGSVFTSSSYLKAAEINHRLFLVRRGEDVKAGICIVEDEKSAGHIVLDDFLIYGGLLFCSDNRQKRSSAVIERFEITELVIAFLVRNFSSIEMSLSPNFEDLRPFLWFNYGKSAAAQFGSELRYTSILDITEFGEVQTDTSSDLFAGLVRPRRRQIKQAIKDGYTTEVGGDVDLMTHLYDLTLRKQGLSVSSRKLERVASLHKKLRDEDIGEIITIRSQTREVLYMISIGYNLSTGYALYAAGNPERRDQAAGTLAYWEAAKWLAAEKQIKAFDLEGINSPSRSWFKTGFGGTIKPYFEVKINNL